MYLGLLLLFGRVRDIRFGVIRIINIIKIIRVITVITLPWGIMVVT